MELFQKWCLLLLFLEQVIASEDDKWIVKNSTAKASPSNCKNITIKVPDPYLNVRLVEKNSSCSGTLQVLQNKNWKSACTEQLNGSQLKRLCLELGCEEPWQYNGEPDQKDIPHKSENEMQDLNVTLQSCTDPKASWLACKDPSFQLPVRLTGGKDSCSGKVEVHVWQQWKPLCEKGMTKDTAEQICKQAHCSGVLKFSESKQVDSSAVHCPLHSRDLFQCQGLLQETECTTVNVTCEGSKPRLVYRLANGPSECVGKVMVYHQNKWEKVCNDSKLSANDICRSLNCGGIKEIQNAPPSKRKQQGMYCSISNTNLDDCFHSLTTKDCSMDWIICTGYKEPNHTGQTVWNVFSGILAVMLLVVLLVKFGPLLWQKIYKKVFRKKERQWIGPTQSQSVSFHRNQHALQPSPRLADSNSDNDYTSTPSKRQSGTYPALERALVNLNTGASSARNSGYDYEPRAC
ncbi:scavenger receptor cysteine-rich type 1 protein M160-like isoform X2 [Polypterus senegalus]|nr:scavenger receptor cysteine-rich type 1 protein M160-like isoform X2 [Polypterus senegalus]XP_039623445.1 scavenger receptor cysteine-rich type 1 protein M160-like isoform X2 [Polypterus senegalus]